jgi:hypothetical protein
MMTRAGYDTVCAVLPRDGVYVCARGYEDIRVISSFHLKFQHPAQAQWGISKFRAVCEENARESKREANLIMPSCPSAMQHAHPKV